MLFIGAYRPSFGIMIDRKVVGEDPNIVTPVVVVIKLLEITQLSLPIVSDVALFQSFRMEVK
jgi:hypothetical protein